jgi:hypothetical protein
VGGARGSERVERVSQVSRVSRVERIRSGGGSEATLGGVGCGVVWGMECGGVVVRCA